MPRQSLKRQQEERESLIDEYTALLNETNKLREQLNPPQLDSCINIYESRAKLVPEGKLILKSSGEVVWFEFENIYALKIIPRLTFRTQNDETFGTLDFQTIPAKQNVAIVLSQPYLDTARSGEIIEFELIILNALDTSISNSWRGKFRLVKETGKIEWI